MQITNKNLKNETYEFGNLKTSIGKMVFIGIFVTLVPLIIICIIYGPTVVIANVIEAKPWVLITGLAAAPSIVLTWAWREIHKRKDEEFAGVKQIIEKENQKIQLESQNIKKQNLEIQKQTLNVQQNNLRVDIDNLEIVKSGQMSTRFSKALEQLGSDKAELAIGGLYECEQIYLESNKYGKSILNAITAFVRRRIKEFDEDNYKKLNYNVENSKTDNEERIIRNDLDGDIIAALKVLGSNTFKELKNRRNRIDLTNISLRNTKIQNLNLDFFDFSFSNLESSSFWGSSQEGTLFYSASLKNTIGCQGADKKQSQPYKESDVQVIDLPDSAIERKEKDSSEETTKIEITEADVPGQNKLDNNIGLKPKRQRASLTRAKVKVRRKTDKEKKRIIIQNQQ